MKTARFHTSMAAALFASMAVSMTTAPQAAASCMFPGTVVAPASGTNLPANPSLFVFVPSGTKPPVVRVHSEAGETPFTVTEVAKAPALVSYRIDVSVDAGHTLVVRVENPDWPDHGIESNFTIIESAPRTPSSLTVEGVDTEIYQWTCSYQKSHNVRLAHMAAAYRVEWAPTKASFASGATQTLVVPSRMERFYDPEARTVDVEAVVELGHVNCFGHTLAWGGTDPLYVGITALHTDGSTQSLADGPLRLYAPERSFLTKVMEDYLRPAQYRIGAFIFEKTGWSVW